MQHLLEPRLPPVILKPLHSCQPCHPLLPIHTISHPANSLCGYLIFLRRSKHILSCFSSHINQINRLRSSSYKSPEEGLLPWSASSEPDRHSVLLALTNRLPTLVKIHHLNNTPLESYFLECGTPVFLSEMHKQKC